MRQKPDLDGMSEKGVTTREIRVERRFDSDRSVKDMLKSLIRAHFESA